VDALVAKKIRTKPIGIAPLADVIRLPTECLPELVDDADHVVLVDQCPAPAHVRGQCLQDLQVLLNLLRHARALDLDHDGGPVVQGRPMNLADRGGRERHLVEGGEDRLQRAPQLGHDDPPHHVGA